MMRRTIAVMLVGVAGLACGCSKGGANGAGGFQMPPTPVEVASVQQSTVSDRFEAVGTLEADEEIRVVAEVQGRIAKLPFEEGSSIKKGQLIAQIDDAEWRAEVERAQAVRNQNQTSYERWKSVVEQKAGAQQDLDDAEARLKVSEAELALAQSRLRKAHITAPFSGVVGARQVSLGEFVDPGVVITDLASMDEMRVTFSVPERFIPDLKRGSHVQVSVTAYPDEKWDGRIDVVEPVIDAQTRNVKILARVPNKEHRLRPGMSANVSATLSERPNALTIPSEAVIAEGDQFFVYLIKPDSTVTRVPLTVGTRQPGSVEVLGQLEPGAMIVRAGHQKLFEGAKVMPIPAQGEPPASEGAPAEGKEGVQG
ncbi:MAG TPA: efflux RND transporter periplasmic adaptor subunit [bacterium]|nr:efflux RND transporter periplasmic adaptor subunit [bacterium]